MTDDKYFGEDTVEWLWTTFKSTKGYTVSTKLLDWVIGQDKALQECYLCLDEWVHKLVWLKEKKWWKFWEKTDSEKGKAKDQLPAGPYLLLLGDAGTGKSLIGRALADKLSELYRKHSIDTYDILSWQNKVIPSEPIITIQPAGLGQRVLSDSRKKIDRGSKLKGRLVNILCGFLITVGLGAVGIGLWNMIELMNSYGISLVYAFANTLSFFIGGGSLLLGGFFIWFISRAFNSMGGVQQGIGGASTSKGPKILVDNTTQVAPFIDATGHRSSQLFGDIAWDPYQTGGLGTPEHQRVNAGDVHRALMGILYIDEIKNLDGGEAITLLTVLEDGQLPITMRSRWGEGGSAAMCVSTQAVPCMTFLVAAGNFDSIPMIHPALMDRIIGYGKVVRMNNDMLNSVENRRKYVQFIAQESTRFHMPPFSREACIELIGEARRRSGKADSLTTKFRPMISIVKTAGTLAINEGKDTVEAKHVKEAIEEHCKSIEAQILEKNTEEIIKYRDISPNDKPKLGLVHGIAVVGNVDMVGMVIPIKASMVQKKDKQDGYYTVTGINEKKGVWINDSVKKVRHVILQKYGVDIAKEYMTHIDFAQEAGVDGPSAGITMAIALCSLITGRPIRQDVAVTGEINIGIDGKINITPIGGVYYKIKAAERIGFKKVVIPMKNYQYNYSKEDFSIEVVGAETLEDYLKEVLVGRPEGL